MEEYKSFWVNYVNFSGRATRKQFWLPVLFNFVISAILGCISSTLAGIFSALLIIPNLSIAFRRMHDINKSAAWILISLVPVVGWIIYLVFCCTASVDEDNNYDVTE